MRFVGAMLAVFEQREASHFVVTKITVVVVVAAWTNHGAGATFPDIILGESRLFWETAENSGRFAETANASALIGGLKSV